MDNPGYDSTVIAILAFELMDPEPLPSRVIILSYHVVRPIFTNTIKAIEITITTPQKLQ